MKKLQNSSIPTPVPPQSIWLLALSAEDAVIKVTGLTMKYLYDLDQISAMRHEGHIWSLRKKWRNSNRSVICYIFSICGIFTVL